MKPTGYFLIAVIAGSNAWACLQGYRLPPIPPKLPFDPSPLETLKRPGADDLKRDAALVIVAPKFEGPTQFQYGIDDHRKKAYQNVIDEVGKEPAEKLAYEEKLDRAVARIYLGQYAPAIVELLELEKERQTYIGASALGTAYELAGELPKAKTWIEEGIKRNKDGHDGSEWLHVAIIQTKLSINKNSKWLDKHSVIDGHPLLTDEDMLHAIEYQLNERLSFITDDDPVVADLFFSAGLRTQQLWKRNYYFDQSLRFGKIRAAQIKKERFY